METRISELVLKVKLDSFCAMPYREITGNIFNSNAEALVNTVNCVGPMGKGIALEFRRRFPDMFEVYKQVCERGELRPGSILPYRKSKPWILNFAVKDDWKHPSKVIWIEQCLDKFCAWYPKTGLKSVAFPWMGAMNGGIPLEKIKEVTRRYLEHLPDIEIEVYTFDPSAQDPLFERLLRSKEALSIENFREASGIRRGQVEALYGLLEEKGVTSLSHVSESGILGKTSLDRLYDYLRKEEPDSASELPTFGQLNLFD